MKYVVGRVEVSTEDPRGRQEDMEVIGAAFNDDYLIEETDRYPEAIVGVEIEDGYIVLYTVKIKPRILH